MSEEKSNEVVELMQEEALEQLETLQEDNNRKNEEILDDAKQKIKDIYNDLKTYVQNNSDPESIKNAIAKAKDETLKVMNITKDKVIEFSNSDQFKATVEAGKEFLISAGNLVGEGFKAGSEVLMQNDNVRKIVDKADQKLDVLRENEGLKNALNSAEEASAKVSDAVFNGIRSFLEKKDRGGQ